MINASLSGQLVAPDRDPILPLNSTIPALILGINCPAVSLLEVPELPYLWFKLKAAMMRASSGLEAYGCGTVTLSELTVVLRCEQAEQESVCSPHQDSGCIYVYTCMRV